MTGRRIYLASSWRNGFQPELVPILRAMGHEVYDFRHPKPDDTGFSWGDIAADWQDWTAKAYVEGLSHPVAEAGYRSDIDALDWCDTCVLLQPCGRSAHLELGYAVGKGKATAVLIPTGIDIEPELMVKMCDKVCVGFHDLYRWLESLDRTGNDPVPSNHFNAIPALVATASDPSSDPQEEAPE